MIPATGRVEGILALYSAPLNQQGLRQQAGLISRPTSSLCAATPSPRTAAPATTSLRGQSFGARKSTFSENSTARKPSPTPQPDSVAAERRHSSQPSNLSSSGREPSLAPWTPGDALPPPDRGEGGVPAAGSGVAPVAGKDKETELIFTLERRGDGWGEEIVPHLVVERRPLKPPKKRRRGRDLPAPWEDGSLEQFLVEVGVPEAKVDAAAARAVSWRITPGGRPLIDRRRRSRVERNMRMVAQHLIEECGVPPGPTGVGAVLLKVPEVLLCKPITNDRWDRRVVELAGFMHEHGHCNVPEDWPKAPELGLWVKRQRVARAQGALTEERLQILRAFGFEFGAVAQMTVEWEKRFDQLLDWLLWNDERGTAVGWLAADWGARGGVTARQLSLWVQLQREFRRRNLLCNESIKRLDAINFQWELTEGTPEARRWVSQLGRLLYVIERQMVEATAPKPPSVDLLRLERRAAEAGTVGQAASRQETGEGDVDGPNESAGSRSDAAGDVAAPAARGLGRRHKLEVQLQHDIAARRKALAAAALEPGMGFWLAKQRMFWRKRMLSKEQVLMLELAGVQLDLYSSTEWRMMAHKAARFLLAAITSPPPHDVQARQEVDELGLSRNLSPRLLPSSVASYTASPAASPRASQLRRPPTTANGTVAGPSVSAANTSAGLGLRRFLVGMARNTGLPGLGEELQAEEDVREAEAAVTTEMPNRLAVRRWVDTQRMQWEARRLTTSQLRYLTLCGITWVLSDEVMHMSDELWWRYCGELQALVEASGRPPVPSGQPTPLREWLAHQKALRALGTMQPEREAALTALGVNWTITRSENERTWDMRLSELLAFQYEFGHCLVPQRWERNKSLGQWLSRQKLAWRNGELSASRIAQLHALGVEVHAVPSAPPQRIIRAPE